MSNSPDFKIHSQRAHQFIESPMHALPSKCNSELDSDDSHAYWKFEMNGDKILTLQYCVFPGRNQLVELFCESLARLCETKSLEDLIKLSFRELESYLRVENHQLALEGDFLYLNDLFLSVKSDLIVAIIYNKLSLKLKKRVAAPWESLSLVKKIIFCTEVLEEINILFLSSRPMTLVHIEDQKIMINVGDFFADLVTIEKLLNKIFISQTAKSSLKVVAVQ